MSEYLVGRPESEAGSPSEFRTTMERDDKPGPRLSLVPGRPATGRVDVSLVSSGVRHLVPSVEPARVFSQLAGICVPAVADECTIEISEHGGHRYRIRQPAGGHPRTQLRESDETDSTWCTDTRNPAVGTDFVRATFSSSDGDCREYSGVVVCRWTDGYQPIDADADLVGLLIDHSNSVIERERLLTQVADLRANASHGLGLPGHQRIAAAVGILMALHHLSAAQAADLLSRASHHTHQSLRGVADTVLRTGAMPEHVQRQSRPTDVQSAPEDRGLSQGQRRDAG